MKINVVIKCLTRFIKTLSNYFIFHFKEKNLKIHPPLLGLFSKLNQECAK